MQQGGFLQQAARREGNTETIALRNGKRAVTRRWDPASNEFKFTAIGKKYYSTLRRNYVVDVPIIIKGKRKNGTRYEIKSHTKMEKLGMRPVEVPLNLTLDQRREYIKRAVEAAVAKDKPLYQVSDEEWSYDAHGTWAIHEETVGVDPDSGKPEAMCFWTGGREHQNPLSATRCCTQRLSARRRSRLSGRPTTSALRGKWQRF